MSLNTDIRDVRNSAHLRHDQAGARKAAGPQSGKADVGRVSCCQLIDEAKGIRLPRVGAYRAFALLSSYPRWRGRVA